MDLYSISSRECGKYSHSQVHFDLVCAVKTTDLTRGYKSYELLFISIVKDRTFNLQWGVWETSFSPDGSGDNVPNW